MDEQVILACNDEGEFEEYIPRMVGHTGKGRRHLAVTVLIFNSKGELLLQKRKHKIFDNVWCFSADTHPYHLQGKDETLEEATLRALKEDFNIPLIPLRNLGFFNYFGKDGKYCENQQAVFCENEHCAMMVGEYDGEVSLNPNAGYEYAWMSKKDFLKDFEENPQKYAPWVPGGIEVLEEKGFFDE